VPKPGAAPSLMCTLSRQIQVGALAKPEFSHAFVVDTQAHRRIKMPARLTLEKQG
jgi:hypothetical protein